MKAGQKCGLKSLLRFGFAAMHDLSSLFASQFHAVEFQHHHVGFQVSLSDRFFLSEH